MSSEIFKRTEKLLTMERMNKLFVDAGTDDVPCNAINPKINTAGPLSNRKIYVNFGFVNMEDEDRIYRVSRQISFKTWRILRTIGIPEGIRRE